MVYVFSLPAPGCFFSEPAAGKRCRNLYGKSRPGRVHSPLKTETIRDGKLRAEKKKKPLPPQKKREAVPGSSGRDPISPSSSPG